ncbi:MAG: sodium:proton antiporter [Lachnospiraceae bacterium]|nr:sodium:proton antiporter [Lachnospiraceae bacterium]
MYSFLFLISVLLALIVIIGFFNEKVTHLTYEISLLLFSAVAGGIITFLYAQYANYSIGELLQNVQVFDLNKFLMDGVLCFMLFAGSRNLKLISFRKQARAVSVLAFFCTLLGAVLYGLLFYAVSMLLHLPFTLPMCLMFGSIIAPTDPIAATSILKQFGLPKKVGFLMEAESLLNDGVGVALFVCFSGVVAASESESFLLLMGREILGAVVIGTAVSAICLYLLFHTEDDHRRIFSSLLSVALSFFLCELFDCSGAIACVINGVLFSSVRGKVQKEEELKELDSFWETLDILLNSILYVILGLTFVRILQMPMVGFLSIAAVFINFISRFFSVWAGTFFLGPIPDGYKRNGFSMLFTWGGLRGGLSIALAMSTASIVNNDTYHIILGCAYAIVFFTTVIQGLSMKKVYESIKH